MILALNPGGGFLGHSTSAGMWVIDSRVTLRNS
jgi:hypothetical protein